MNSVLSFILLSGLLSCNVNIRGGTVEKGSTQFPAIPAQVLTGQQYWDSDGNLRTGTMENFGVFNLQDSFPGEGYYNGSLINLPSASQIAVGTTLLGLAGTYSGNFDANAGSNACRDFGTLQMTLSSENTTYAGAGSSPAFPAGYRDIPDIFKDDDGFFNSDAGCNSECTQIVSVTAAQHAAFSDCGTTQTSIASRISDCAGQNGSAATWVGAANGTSGEGTWKLVTHLGQNKEVWQDQRTLLLWSSKVSSSDNWCIAAGNAQSGDTSNYCNSTTYQPFYPTAESYCAEDNTVPAVAAEATGLVVGGAWSGTYVAAKGGMGANSSTLKVRWRLPSLHDYDQAEVDGIRYVMPDMGSFGSGYEWSASILSQNRAVAWAFLGDYGYIYPNGRGNTSVVRCIGR